MTTPPSTYPGGSMMGDDIYAELARYDLAQIKAKPTVARESATKKLTGQTNASDDAILQALWRLMQEKSFVSIVRRFDRLLEKRLIR